MSEPSTVTELADRYIERSCELDPIKATALGVPGGDDRLTDYSPDGVEERVGARSRHPRDAWPASTPPTTTSVAARPS